MTAPMSPELRDTLERVAAHAPDLRPDAHQTWARGRAARRRDRLVTGVAALSLVAVVAGLALLTGGLRQSAAPIQPAGPDAAGAVPTQLWGLPDHLVEFGQDSRYHWAHGVGESNLAIGPGAVAFLEGSGAGALPVVVTRDGDYHPLDLPDYVAAGFGAIAGHGDVSDTMVLSPDGTRLAWVQGAPAAGRTDYSPVPTAIRVTDLDTGETSDTDLRPLLTSGQALLPHRLTWSPDGRWLAWQGAELAQYNGSGSGTGRLDRQAGRIEVATGRHRSLPDADRRDLLAVASDGGVLFRDRGGRLGAWPGRAGSLDDIEEADALGAVSPDGLLLALGRWLPTDSVPVMEVRTGRLRERDLPPGSVAAPAGVEPVGWVDDQHLMAVVTPESPQEGAHLALMTSPTVPASGAAHRVLTRIDAGIDGRSLSVATAAIDLDRPTAEFPEPDWPASDEQRVAVTLLALAGVALAAYLLRRRLRRR